MIYKKVVIRQTNGVDEYHWGKIDAWEKGGLLLVEWGEKENRKRKAFSPNTILEINLFPLDAEQQNPKEAPPSTPKTEESDTPRTDNIKTALDDGEISCAEAWDEVRKIGSEYNKVLEPKDEGTPKIKAKHLFYVEFSGTCNHIVEADEVYKQEDGLLTFWLGNEMIAACKEYKYFTKM